MSNEDGHAQGGKVLIVYYSYSGNTRKVAKAIQSVTGGDIVEAEPVTPYSSNYSAVVQQARQELSSGYRPEIKATDVDLRAYDTIFLGSPNWCQTIAPPLISFLAKSDLSGKKLIPFVTHGGGGLGRSAIDIAALCPQARVLESLALRGADVKAAEKWLSRNWPV